MSEEAWAELARTHGPDVAMETLAQMLDIVIGEPFKAGDVVRDAWREVAASIAAVTAASSGAAHELEYYAESAAVVACADNPERS